MDIRQKKRRAMVLTIILVLYILFLFIVSVIRVPSQVSSIYGIDKVVHFAEYFFLAGLLVKFLEVYSAKNIFYTALIVGIVFMIFSEIIQTFVPSRSFSLYDLIADLLGFIVGLKVFK